MYNRPKRIRPKTDFLSTYRSNESAELTPKFSVVYVFVVITLSRPERQLRLFLVT